MVQTVVFDLGKVLVDFDYTIAARKIAASSKITLEDFARFISHSPLFLQYETGLLTSEEFYQQICGATGFRGSLEEFGASFGGIFSPIEPMIRLQTALREQGIPTYIFSNTNDLAIRAVRRNFPFFANFDGYILSYEHRAMKPDAKLYEVVERFSGHHGSEILYLDDRPENIAAGAARGWQVILQESPEKSRAAIERLGLLNHAPTKS
ncbi:MAG TPA: HAD family phosphatase [Candidatus Binatia bacterium]|jgi:FMN phosphatase YigB (HAD superfamily)|nr:HAD family phosphatase [Candidatus Binatia bacterium]